MLHLGHTLVVMVTSHLHALPGRVYIVPICVYAASETHVLYLQTVVHCTGDWGAYEVTESIW